jgi:DNA mismatch repair ATPase MutS
MVEPCFLQSGAFFEAYGESAFTAANALGCRVSTNAHGWSMAGFPVAGLETVMERLESLRLSPAATERLVRDQPPDRP